MESCRRCRGAWWGVAMIAIAIAVVAVGVSAQPQPLPRPESQNETQAMQALRQSLEIGDSSWPARADPCTSWVGVACDDGHVVSIAISGRNVTMASGARHPVFAMDSLLGLPALKRLTVSDFSVPGTLPSWLGNLSALESLDFSNSSVNGSIPPSLGQLSRLRSLSLARNSLSGNIPWELSNLSSMQLLDLSSNMMSGTIPAPLLNLPELQVLDLSHNYLSGPIPDKLTGLVGLRRLILAYNYFSGAIPRLGSLQLLSAIDLSRNNLSGAVPAALGNLSRLVTLGLNDNHLNGTVPPELTLCSELEALNLGGNLLTGNLPLSMGSLLQLKRLNLSMNALTGSMPPGWDSLVLLERVDLSHNLFYGPLPADLARLPTLAVLNVSDNFFNESLPAVLPKVTVTKKNCFANATRQHTVRACAKFYADRGVTVPRDPTPSSAEPARNATAPAAPSQGGRESSKEKHLVPLFAGIGGGLGLIILVGLFALCVHRIERKERSPSGGNRSGGPAESGFGSGGAGIIVSRLGEAFSYTQLQHATKKFSGANLISQGHSGDLYKGLLDGGTTVVVKRIEASKFRKDSYVPELEVYGRASHSRLVSLVGYCLEREDEKLLVYKYMPNGDLASALHTKGSPGPGDVLRSLDWITRLKVAIGAAEALSYLHHDSQPPLVHRDIKASSILLDDKFEVRLGSLSEVRSQDGDSHPGLIRRLLGLSQSSDQGIRDAGQAVASCALDVYSYGKVLLELVSGKLGISGVSDPRTDAWLDWAMPLINPHDKESLPKLVDPSLIVDEDLLEEVWAVAIIAKACLNPKPQKRPSMRHVLKALENPHKVVRQDFQFSDTLAMRTSSHSSWNEALFGSWRHSSVIPGTLREEYQMKAGGIGAGSRVEYPQSHTRRGSSDIVPEPISENDYPRSR
ncbi:hypothetical protein MPTK1_8g14310 [Marchantia polymorpha subsp. ruderalis]|uniref:Protein kinase domain-containing protein n=1 Tax=Marchantia polymorpha TaxID=3197 RepID=A0A2R6WCY9_MARPO|nr:hypothetical protein MARPO_0108s0058 [Marchantia polymorpha]BBN19861.1 hypothetical protein Mp_8g14310 [Marchantia polymorpha subsp. ruderalis]|eukprot:PTQ31713.1 hypothetical protein MARPO_0108s0058 [Marchantia polymorpha]